MILISQQPENRYRPTKMPFYGHVKTETNRNAISVFGLRLLVRDKTIFSAGFGFILEYMITESPGTLRGVRALLIPVILS